MEELSYSFHLGNDKNKSRKAKKIAQNNKTNTTSFNNNAIQNIKDLGKVNHHNLRMYDNNTELIYTIKGSNNIVSDVKELYFDLFEESRLEYNQKQVRDDRKIKNYFDKISNDTKHDLACEIIIEIGNMNYWEDKSLEEKYKMIDVFKEQIIDLKKVVPDFEIANATIRFDEASPHLHIVGVAVKNGCKTGMKKQVGKSSIFTKESLIIIQDKMREYCLNSFNKIYETNKKLKEKQKGKNQDYTAEERLEFNKKVKELKNNLNDIKNEIDVLEDDKDKREIEIKDLDKEKDDLNDEIDKKKKANNKIILKDKAKLYKENKELKHQLEYEKSLSYQYKVQYKSLKEKTDYLIEKLSRIINILPKFIQELIDKLFIHSNIDIKYFKEQYDPDVIKKREEESKNKKIFNFNNRNYSNDYTNELDYQENSKNDDELEL